MSDFNRLQDAFLKADTLAQQGDEQARVDAAFFAQEIRRLQKVGLEGEDESEGVMPQLNKAIAETAGGLLDFINPFDKYTGSAATGLKSLMGATGIDVAQQAPEGFLENVAYGAGSAAASAFPVAKGAQLLQKAPGMVGKVAQTIAPQLATKSALGAELASGGLASAASSEAERQGYSEPVQQIAGLIAGVGPAFAGPAASALGSVAMDQRLIKSGVDAASSAIAPFTEAGARSLAGRRVRELAGGDERSARVAESLDSGKSQIGLSPAEMTNDPNLIKLQRAAEERDPKLAERNSRRQFEADLAAREGIEVGGRVQDAQEFIAQRQLKFSNTLEDYISAARSSAESKIPKAGMDSIDASRVVASELRQAEKVAKANQKMLWDKIPEDVEVDVSGVKAAIQSLSENATRIGRRNIPSEAIDFLEATKGVSTDRIKEINALYSAMRDTARNATSGELVNKDKARIANNVADSILSSLDNIRPDTDVNKSIVEARTFSREMHDKFSRGEVGQLLKRTTRGGDAVPESLTLQRALGGGGDAGFVAQQDIAAAARGLPETGGVTSATENYLRNIFNDKVFSGDKFSPTAAANFLRTNQRLLGEFPAVRAELEQSISSQSRLKGVTVRAEDLSKSMKASTPSTFSAASPDRAIDSVLSSQNPPKAMASLIAYAKKDASGAALEGVKKAVSKNLMLKALKTLDVPTQAGATSEVRGARLSEALNDEAFEGIVRQAFSKSEMSRLRIIAKELEKLDQARALSSTGETMSMFEPNGLVSVAARVLAARYGAALGGGGVGGSLQSAQILSGRAKRLVERLTNYKAQQLLIDAVQDADLLRSLLLNTNSPQNVKKLEKALAPYIVGSVSGSEDFSSEPTSTGAE